MWRFIEKPAMKFKNGRQNADGNRELQVKRKRAAQHGKKQ